jgi:carbonic anhydrase
VSFSWEPFGRTARDVAPEPTPPPEPETAPETPPRELSGNPARAMAIVTCMDCRIDPLDALGVSLGDAVVLRNAGAQISDDMLRSLQMAHEALGVRTVHVIGHTDCAAYERDAEIAANEAAAGADRIRAVLPNLHARSGLLDLRTGRIS